MMETYIGETECEVKVTYFKVQPPMGPSADSDVDARGFVEIEFEVYVDGKRDYDLEGSMTLADRNRIEEEISDMQLVVEEEMDAKADDLMRGIMEERKMRGRDDQ